MTEWGSKGKGTIRGSWRPIPAPLLLETGFGSCGRPLSSGLLTCWVKAACGDAGDLLGAPSALSGFGSQGRSLESGSRGVCARPKPSSASAMVCPGPCDRVGSCAADRKQRRRKREGREREREKVGSAVQVARGLLGPTFQLPAPLFPVAGGCRRSSH